MPSHSNPRVSSYPSALRKNLSSRHDVWNSLLSRAERRASEPESHLYLPHDSGQEHLRYSFEDSLINHNLEVDSVFRIPLREPLRKKRKAAKRCRPRQSVVPVQHLEVISVASTPQRDDDSDIVLVEEIPSPSSACETTSSDSCVAAKKIAATREFPPKTISASERMANDSRLLGQRSRQPFLHVPLPWQSPERSKPRLSKTTPISTRAVTIPSEESTKPDSSAQWGSDSLEKCESRGKCSDSRDRFAVLDESCIKGGEAVVDPDAEDCSTIRPEPKARPRPHRRKRARLISFSSSSSSRSKNSDPAPVLRREPKRASRKSLMVSSGAHLLNKRGLGSNHSTPVCAASKARRQRKRAPPASPSTSIEQRIGETRSTITSAQCGNILQLKPAKSDIEHGEHIRRSQCRPLTNPKSDLSATGSTNVSVPIFMPGARRCKRKSTSSEPEYTPMPHEDKYLSKGNLVSQQSDDTMQGQYERDLKPVDPEGDSTGDVVLIEAAETDHVREYVLSVSSDSDPSESAFQTGFRTASRKSLLSVSGSSLAESGDRDLQISGFSEEDEDQERIHSADLGLTRVMLKLRIKDPCDQETRGSCSGQGVVTRSCVKNGSTRNINGAKTSWSPDSSGRLHSDVGAKARSKPLLRSSQQNDNESTVAEIKKLRDIALMSHRSEEGGRATVSRDPCAPIGNGSEFSRERGRSSNVRNTHRSQELSSSPANGSKNKPKMRPTRFSSSRSRKSVSSTSDSGSTWENFSPSGIACKVIDSSTSDPGKSSPQEGFPVEKRRGSTRKKSTSAGPLKSSLTKKTPPSQAIRRSNATESGILTGKRKKLSQNSIPSGYSATPERQERAVKKQRVEYDAESAEKPKQGRRSGPRGARMRQHLRIISSAEGTVGGLQQTEPSQRPGSRSSPFSISRKGPQQKRALPQDCLPETRAPVSKAEREYLRSCVVKNTAGALKSLKERSRRTSPRLTRQTKPLLCRRCGGRMGSLCTCSIST